MPSRPDPHAPDSRRGTRGSARPVIAIDGPGGSGKSTVARRVATRLGLRYLDTGATYRALTWLALREGVAVTDEAALAALAGQAAITVGTDPRHPEVAVAGVDVSRAIRSREVTNAVSAVSAVPAVRAELVRLQREVIGSGGVVVEGRDIGTVVAPDAPVKIFLTATSEARAHRRHRQLAPVGESAALGLTRAELDRRDAWDSGRATSPLARAADAHEIDSTGLGVEAVVDIVLARCAVAGVVPGQPEAAERAPEGPS